jgi:hypothetical protein
MHVRIQYKLKFDFRSTTFFRRLRRDLHKMTIEGNRKEVRGVRASRIEESHGFTTDHSGKGRDTFPRTMLGANVGGKTKAGQGDRLSY